MSDRRRDLSGVKRLGWALQGRREREGISRATLAKSAGTSAAYIARIEKGEVDPRLNLMLKLGSALGWVIR